MVGISLGDAAATPPDRALSFNGTNQYVTFGPATGTLGATQFTLETWFLRTGTGVGTSTDGLASAIPLVTKGRTEAESPANLNMNYFLGIDALTGVLVGDFEGAVNGVNHPVSGATRIPADGVWHHAAGTYDGTTWRLYLDGRLDTKLVVGNFTPESSSIQHAALGSALTSAATEVPAGFFSGVIDEARIWNIARSGGQIRATKNSQLVDPMTNLRGRWGMDEGGGTSISDSSGNNASGELINSPAWVSGYDFPQDTGAPAAPTNLIASRGDNQVGVSWTASGVADLAGYNVYRSTSPGVDTGGTPLNGTDLVRGTGFNDTTAANGTPYYYVVTAVDTANNSSAASNEHSATPAPGDPVLVGAGDIADCNRSADTQTAALVAGIAGHVFTIGDNAYRDGTASQFSGCYHPTWGLFKSRTRPAPGNHDFHTPGASGYFDYFNGAGNQNGAAGNRDLGYYSYDITGNGATWHVVVLNSECQPSGGEWLPGGCAAGSAQEQWLLNDLQSASTNNIVAIFHTPRWSSAINSSHMQRLWQVLYDHGVDIALGAHWHSYERLGPMDASGQLDPSFGIRGFVVGTGGGMIAGLAGFNTILSTSEARDSFTYGALKLTLSEASYAWQFIPIAGQTFTDGGTQATHGPPPDTVTPVVTVASVLPSTVGQAGTANLTWHASENGNYSVRVGGADCSGGVEIAQGSYSTSPADVVTAVAASSLSDGQNTLRVCVTDAGPNTGSATTTVTRSTEALAVTILSAVPSVVGAAMSSDVTWQASEDGVYSVRVGGVVCTDGVEVASGSYLTSSANVVTPVAASSLAEGSNTIRVCVTDSAPNTGSATTAVTKDAGAPVVAVVVANPSTLGPSTLSTDVTWHADESGSFVVRVGGVDCASGTQVASGSYSTAPVDVVTTVSATALADGLNTVRVCVTDAVANTGSDSISVTKTPPALIALRSFSSGTNGVTTSLVLATPAGVGAGDLLLASITVATPVAVTAPAGWSLIRLDVSGAGSTAAKQGLYYRVAGGSEPASYSWSFAAARGAAGIVLAYQGVDGSAPVEASTGSVTYAKTVTAPSVTTTAVGSMVVGFFGTTGQTTFTAPAGMAELAEVANGSAQKVTGEAAQVLQAAVGASGGKVGTAAAIGRMIGQLVALKPASGGTPSGAAPVVDSVVINQASPKTNDVLSASVTSHDPDGDAVSYSYFWGKNGVDIAGANGATLDLSLTGNGDRGDVISLRVTGSDGTNTSAPVTSAAVTVVDSPPAATVSLSDTTPATNDTLTATATKADADGDAVSLTYVWKVGGTVKQTTTTASPTDGFDLSVAGNGDEGDTITVEVTPNDGTVAGPLATSNATVAAPAVIALRSHSSATNAVGTSLVMPQPTGTIAGDVLLAVVNVIAAPTITAPAGWTQVRNDVSGTGAGSVRQAVYYHVAGIGEPASYTWGFASAHGASGGILAYSGVDNANPIEAATGQAHDLTVSITAPSLTTTAPNSMLVGFFGMNGQRTITPPAGMSEEFEVALANPPGAKVTSESADSLQATAGPSGSRVATASASGRSVGQLVALRPAP